MRSSLIRRVARLCLYRAPLMRVSLIAPQFRLMKGFSTFDEPEERFERRPPGRGRDGEGRGERNFAPRVELDEKRTVYCSGHPETFSQQQIQAMFDGKGEFIETIIVMRNKIPGSAGRALIQCKTSEGAAALIKRAGEKLTVEGAKIELKINAWKKAPTEPVPRDLVLTNLPFSTTEQEIRAMAEKFGTVERCRVPTRPEDGTSRGLAFIVFAEDAAGKAFLEKVNNSEIGGRMARVHMRDPSFRRQS